MSQLPDLRVGDLIRTRRTLKVKQVTNGYVELADVKNGQQFGLYGDEGTLKVEVVRRAKPQAGDVITGAEVKATMWKRGTVFKTDCDAVLVLDKNGDLHSSYSGNAWPITQVDPHSKFKVLHVA